ncbi:MAG TPA: GNAT family N-acetyltransferase [Acidimicrobiales bacterium]|nr:GNAT family N-acetyltransferase [Acidimicrobiales bacterium]
MTISVRRLGPDDAEVVLAAGHLFDAAPNPGWTADVLSRPGHHLLFAFEDEVPVGFATCIEMAHPDKGTEVMIYELGVDEPHRRNGIGRLLVERSLDLARARGCYGAWTVTEDDNAAALATYRSAGAEPDPTCVTQVWDWRAG